MYSGAKLWMYYANIFGTMPPNGSAHLDSDSAIALAFGRNSIPDHDLPSVKKILDRQFPKSHLEMIKYLDAQGFDPGEPNYHIAQTILFYIETGHKPVAAQWELCIALFQMYGNHRLASVMNENRLVCLWPRTGMDRHSSLDVLNDAHAIFSKPSRQCSHPLLIAHDLHMPRVYMLAKRKWINPIVGFKNITRSFDPKSVQKMTTSPARWYWYEFRARAHHLIHGLV